ncbi:hypothetical protein [Streptomyces sp. NPDC093591]|uniref:hypothetical protein n=1 Tax=Streptomyces sp. NPDC093591 TaxID=3366044 RepID=UPI0038231AFC
MTGNAVSRGSDARDEARRIVLVIRAVTDVPVCGAGIARAPEWAPELPHPMPSHPKPPKDSEHI